MACTARTLLAFAKLYAALPMQFLRLFYAYFSTDLFGTVIFFILSPTCSCLLLQSPDKRRQLI